jgi:two-component sensor histidine kinase
MIWRGYLDLPGELEGKLPRIATEAMVALAGISLAIGARIAIDQLVSGVVPFALTFPVIAAATMLAGTRAGAMTLVGCQLLIWYAILPPQRSFAIESPSVVVNLSLTTFAQAVMLAAIAAYRRMTGRLQSESRQRIDDLLLALREMDHRTKNNFQLAVGLLEIQGRNSADPALQSALSRAAARLQAIGGVYRNLALSSADLKAVRLHDYLDEICTRIRDGLLSPAILLELEADPVVVPHEQAIRIGLIINELVTNAVKHAFPDAVGSIMVRLEDASGALTLTVSDDGKGLDDDRSTDGLGAKLITMLARQLGAQHDTVCGPGTTHVFAIPRTAATD